jgi:hypothetical protein
LTKLQAIEALSKQILAIASGADSGILSVGNDMVETPRSPALPVLEPAPKQEQDTATKRTDAAEVEPSVVVTKEPSAPAIGKDGSKPMSSTTYEVKTPSLAKAPESSESIASSSELDGASSSKKPPAVVVSAQAPPKDTRGPYFSGEGVGAELKTTGKVISGKSALKDESKPAPAVKAAPDTAAVPSTTAATKAASVAGKVQPVVANKGTKRKDTSETSDGSSESSDGSSESSYDEEKEPTSKPVPQLTSSSKPVPQLTSSSKPQPQLTSSSESSEEESSEEEQPEPSRKVPAQSRRPPASSSESESESSDESTDTVPQTPPAVALKPHALSQPAPAMPEALTARIVHMTTPSAQ